MLDYMQYRRFYADLSGSNKIAATDNGNKQLAAVKNALHTIFVQRLRFHVTTAGAFTWTVQDDNGTPVPVSGAVSVAVAPSDIPLDFGPLGVPLTQGNNLRVVISGAGAVGWITWEAYQKLTGIDSFAPGTGAQ